MSPLSDSTKQELLLLLRRFKRERFHPTIKLDGVTSAEAHAVLCVCMAKEHGIDPVQPRMVAAWLQQTPSALSQTLKAIEEKGYIERHRRSDDSRSVSLVLTEKGKELACEFRKAQDVFFDDLVECIGEEDLSHLLKTFSKIYDHLSQKADEGMIERGDSKGFEHPSHPPFPHAFHGGMCEIKEEGDEAKELSRQEKKAHKQSKVDKDTECE